MRTVNIQNDCGLNVTKGTDFLFNLESLIIRSLVLVASNCSER